MAQPPDLDYWSVPRCFDGEAVAILGGGSSLTQEQADYVHGKCRVIAINRAGVPSPKRATSWVYAPWADWLWACDADRFWRFHPEAVEFPGTKIVVRGAHAVAPSTWRKLADLAGCGVKVLRHSGRGYPAPVRHDGLSPDQAVVRGTNAVAQILSILPFTGAHTAILLGVDMRGEHWHGGYGEVTQPDYATQIIPAFAQLALQLAEADVVVLNASPGSALRDFIPVKLTDVI